MQLHIRLLWWAGLLLSLLTGDAEGRQGSNLNIEYFQPATLPCSATDDNTVIQYVHFWILPSGDVRRPRYQGSEDGTHEDGIHVKLQDNGFMLYIDSVDDADFGTYHCIVNIGRNETDVIKVGLNLGGPFYKPEAREELIANVIIGGITAGCTLVALTFIWMLCANCRCHNEDDAIGQSGGLSNVGFVSESKTGNELGWHRDIGLTRLGDSVYYMADGLPSSPADHARGGNDFKKRSQSSETGHSRSDRLSSTDSGHYQSIGSLGRNSSVLSEADLDKICVDIEQGEASVLDLSDTNDNAIIANSDAHGMDTQQKLSVRYASGPDISGIEASSGSVDAHDTASNENEDTVPIYATPMKRKPQHTALVETYGPINAPTLEKSATVTIVTAHIEHIDAEHGGDIIIDIASELPDTYTDPKANYQDSLEETVAVFDTYTTVGVEDKVSAIAANSEITVKDPFSITKVTDGAGKTLLASQAGGSNFTQKTATSTSQSISRNESTTSQSSEVDVKTIVNYNNVLASLVGARMKKSTSRSSEHEQASSDTDDSEKSIQDVRL